MNPEIDERDKEILQHRLNEWSTRNGPRIGDWCEMLDGSLRRFTHDWGDSIQVTSSLTGLGSFYFGDGYMSYSGGLNRAINKEQLVDTGKTINGPVWFFHHDYWMAHNGVYFKVPCKVYKQI